MEKAGAGPWLRKAGEMGDAIGYFNAGNCLVFGTMGVEESEMEGIDMWGKGAELVKKNGGKGLERWDEESNEKTACEKALDLSGLLRRGGGTVLRRT